MLLLRRMRWLADFMTWLGVLATVTPNAEAGSGVAGMARCDSGLWMTGQLWLAGANQLAGRLAAVRCCRLGWCGWLAGWLDSWLAA